jgi:UDP-N-acetylglucosamine--N-acetylmuramyl-(pentapeptide) pyrophosphoryl-undecaprenol N-acetylglucosamine transferase
MSEPRPILLAAGGTGGHLFPAEALALELRKRGYKVELASDERAVGYAGQFPADVLHEIISGTVTGAGLFGKIRGVLKLMSGVLQARKLMAKVRPAIVVGFGGYPTVPPLLAASNRRIPTLIHEQNAVMGRANRFLAGKVSAIATGFEIVPIGKGPKPVCVGIPVRDAVLQAAKLPFPDMNTIHLCVFGGSQGARVMSEIVPNAIALLPENLRAKLNIVQQARKEDVDAVRAIYAKACVTADVQSFFSDLPMHMANSHLVIGRGGASTVAELGVIGRASILVPLPGSLDQDQAANALVLQKAGAAIVVKQSDFTAELLATELTKQLQNGDELKAQGQRAKAIGISDAASRLADLVISHLRK